jgi:Zn-dependent M28 family amino/carboxypeptidase
LQQKAKRRAGTFLLITVAATLGVAGSYAAAAQPRFSLDHLRRDTKTLSSDAFGGRAPLTPDEIRTRRYIVRAMRAAGLQPGAHGSFIQPVPLLKTETKRTPAPLFRASGPKGTLNLAYGDDLTLSISRLVPEVDLESSPIVFVGYGITAKDRGWDDYAGVDVRGRTVLILINDPDWQQPAGKGPFGGAAMTYYGRWMYKYEEAARHGAAAAIIIHNERSASSNFGVVVSSVTGPRLALDQPLAGGPVRPVEAWIRHDAAAQLVALGGENLAQLEEEAAVAGFRARPLGITASIHFEVTSRRGVSGNVVGLLPGRSHPHEYVIYTAHWDHLGHCPADRRGDAICNGAIDNATGVAGLLELVRAFAHGRRPERSIVFIATTGEEYGLLGSQYYATHPLFPLDRTVTEIDLDPLSFMQGRTRDVSMIADQSDLTAIVRRVASGQHRVVTPDPEPELGSRYRSDTLSFSRAGVPVVYMQGGVEVRGRPRGWGRDYLARYFERDYHRPSDEYDPDWDWAGALEDLALYHDVGAVLANGRAWPNWFPDDEFRSARDKLLRPHQQP